MPSYCLLEHCKRPFAVSFEVVRPRTGLAGLVAGVEERAAVDREAAAADAGREAVAERVERGYSPIQIVAPAAGEAFPVTARGTAMRGKRLERRTDPVEWDPGCAAGLDERDPTEHRPLVAALVSARAVRRDQPLGFVKAERRGGAAAAGGELADRQLACHLT